MKQIILFMLLVFSLPALAAVEYTYNAENYRVQIEYIQIMPAKREVHISIAKINKATYDIETYGYVLAGSTYQNFANLTGSAGLKISKQLQDGAYNWIINSGRIDEIVAGGPLPGNYTRPTLTLRD